MGVTAGVPPRVDAGVKAGLLDLVDRALEQGWTTARACAVLEIDGRRYRRWQHRRSAGRLDDHTAGGTAVHAITPFERRAILELFERWGDIDGRLPQARTPRAPTRTWSGCHRRRCIAYWQPRGLFCPPATAHPGCGAALPDWIEWKRHQIWIYDMTHFPRAGRVAYAVLDVVTRKWLATLVTAEEDRHPSTGRVSGDALDSEGLWPAVEARQAQRTRHDGDGDGDEEPTLLVMSDNGPQMRAGTTREFWALCSIAPTSAGPAPRLTRHGSRRCSATSRPSGPTSRRSPTPTCCEPNSTSSARTTTPGACTPPWATSPPTTSTRAEATPSARPDETASPGPAAPASPTIATTTDTSHEHTRPMRRNQTPKNGHLLRSTSVVGA